MFNFTFKLIACLLLCLLFITKPTKLYGGRFNDLEHLIGKRDAVIISDPKSHPIYSKNEDVQLIPASILKIYTALVALHYLGPDYKFVTEFYMDRHSNLKVKGYGDPLLISESIAEMMNRLSKKLGVECKRINDLILDDSYFKSPIMIPGVQSSYEPYDAPNGALCVNFNTINFKRNQNGIFISAEPQTPLLPFILARVDSSQMDHGRVVLSNKKNEITYYAGHLFLYFLKKEGGKFSGKIRLGTVRKEDDRFVYRYVSSFSLEQIISKLFEYSNNFIANQLLIAVGANVYGPPGNLEKGVRAASTYAKNTLQTDNIRIEEGSGISRNNRISAENVHKILKVFEPYYFLLRQMGQMYYKTGTLKGINTRAGYIKDKKGGLYPFVLLINTPGKSPEPIMDIIVRKLN